MISAFFLVGFGTVSLQIHLVPLLVMQKVEPMRAAMALSLFSAALIVGRLAGGMLMDRFFAPRVVEERYLGLMESCAERLLPSGAGEVQLGAADVKAVIAQMQTVAILVLQMQLSVASGWGGGHSIRVLRVGVVHTNVSSQAQQISAVSCSKPYGLATWKSETWLR